MYVTLCEITTLFPIVPRFKQILFLHQLSSSSNIRVVVKHIKVPTFLFSFHFFRIKKLMQLLDYSLLLRWLSFHHFSVYSYFSSARLNYIQEKILSCCVPQRSCLTFISVAGKRSTLFHVLAQFFLLFSIVFAKFLKLQPK